MRGPEQPTIGNFESKKEELMAALEPVNERFVTPAMQAVIDEEAAKGWQVLGQSFVNRNDPERGNSVRLIRGDEQGYDTMTVSTDREHEREGLCKVSRFTRDDGEWSTKY
ncbi:hypothetical protein HY624_04130 [Candidatus Uhrbacteria bacterium]|nr:hypothetical protein [Candidatus Uhrbacteria bacterium]